jgi:simple sugar transport system permease protein
MKRILKLYLERPELAALVMLVLLVILFQLRSNGIFLSGQNLRGVLGFLPEVALVAVGVGLLMICGEFDLSVGSTYAIMPMTVCLLANAGWGFVPAMIAGLLVCVAIGLVNGFITIRFSIPSFITTLGMLYIVRSLTVVMSGGFPPRFPTEAPAWLFVGFVGPFRASLFWFLALALIATLLLERSNFGNWIRATGGQLEAAASMGIKTGAVKVACFVICALFAGFAGTLQVMRLGSPLPSAGDGLELQAVAAAVIGGTALTGGIGTVLGAVVGAMLIRAIDNGLVLSQVDSNWFKFAIGALTIVAVISNVWLRRVGRRLKVEA